MRTVNINRDKLLATVRENLTKHVNEYNEAVTQYRSHLVTVLQENSKIHQKNIRTAKAGLADGQTINQYDLASMKTLPPMPTSYEDAYNKAIKMLEFSADEVIELTSDVFNQLVLDEWSWKGQFETTNAFYKSVGAAR